MKKLMTKNNSYVLGAMFIFALFAYITYKTPLAGDDWGYAINSSSGNPFKTALDFYYSWSGRYFSELWGMIVPCRKWLWNIINPVLFSCIFVCIYKLSGVKSNPIIASIFILAFMLSVDDNLRMETYTWIMGTTYVIPLLLSLVYLLIADKVINNITINKQEIVLSNVLLFVIGLMMENIAAAMVAAILILLIYSYIKDKKVSKKLIINLIVSLTSFIIMRSSPGSAYRLISEHGEWNNLSLFEKIAEAYPNFVEMSFINNNYAIALFSLMLAIIMFFPKSTSNNKWYKYISLIIIVFGVLETFLFIFNINVLQGTLKTITLIFWPLYIINAFVSIYLYVVDKKRMMKIVFVLLIGGLSVAAMLLSPIYGSRSSLYLVYYMLLASIMILEETNINKLISVALCVILLVVVCDRTYEYITKYNLVGIRQEERLEIIKYYQEHPEDEEVWIPRFSIYSIHGADIEEGDSYHFETFKEYYNLPQSADNIIFYFVED